MKFQKKYIFIATLLALVFLPIHHVYAEGVVDNIISAFFGLGNVAVGLVLKFLGNIIHTIILVPLQAILAAVGLGLDTVIDITIVKMSDTINNMSGINTAWKLTRDVMNIVFIFMLVYEAILLILGMSSTQKIGRWIGFLVLAALLVNFSLFFTKVLIDASNIVTIGIYNVIISNSSITLTLPGYGTSTVKGLAIPFITKMGVTKMVNADVISTFAETKIVQMELFFIIILLIAIFVFLSAIVLFVVRYIILIILLMLSPIGFMGSALPFIKKYSDQWWESLNGQLLFPPLFMFFTWMTLTLLDSANFTISNAAFTTGATSSDFFNFALNYSLVVGMMIATIVISKSTSTKGASQIKSLTSTATSFAGGVVLGGSARLARNTVGRAGGAISDSEQMKRWATEGNAAQRVLARTGLAASNKAATSTFDTRSTKSFGSLAKTAGFGADYGKVDAKKDNYRAIVDKRIKDAVEKEKMYKPTDIAVNDAKAKLNESTAEGRRFKAEEDERKRIHEEYIRSEDYANNEGKILNDDKAKLADTEKELSTEKASVEHTKSVVEQLKKDMSKDMDDLKAKEKAATTDVARSQIQKEILDLQSNPDYRRKMAEFADNIKRQQELLSKQSENVLNLNEKALSQRKSIKEREYERDNYMSEEKKALIATSGGTSVKKIDKTDYIVDANGNIMLDSNGNKMEATADHKNYRVIDNAFAQRMNARASVAESKPVWNWARNVIAFPTAVVGITPQTYSPNERRKLAAKLKAEGKGKSKKDKALEALKDYNAELNPEETAETPKEEPKSENSGGGGDSGAGGGATA